MNGYGNYHEESDADDEYERGGLMSPDQDQFPLRSPTESDGQSAENTPTIYQRMGEATASPRGLMTRWSPEDVAEFIGNLGMDSYAHAFIDNEITGEVLGELLHEELQDLGIESVGHRMTMLRAVYEVKLRQAIPIMHDHYVPPSADANAPDSHATQDDVARIFTQIKLRDERLMAAEEDLRILREDLNRALEESRRMREDILPALRKAKNINEPLPTPDSAVHSTLIPSPQDAIYPDAQKPIGGLSRKYSKKALFTGPGKMPSPTLNDSTTLNPSAAAQAASAQLSASMSSNGSQPSPRPNQLPSPTSPQYSARAAPSSRYAQHPATEDPWTNYNSGSTQSDRTTSSTRRTPAISTAQTPTTIAEEMQQTAPRDRDRDRTRERDRDRDAGRDQGMEFMKSFRVSMDESCYKVLPIALRKYQIEDDWRQYSLYIVHGDQERCLGLHEKPLILFKQLANEGKKPMFMLRKHAAPQEGYNAQRSDTAGPAGVGSLSGATLASGAGAAGRVASYAGSVQLPGGVL